MPIEFRCGQCNQLLRVPDDSAGKNARCPKCQALMTVPDASAPVTSDISASMSDLYPPATAPTAPQANFSPPPGSAAAPPSPANPYSEAAGGSPFGGPALDKLNPYASPSAAVFPAQFIPEGQRPGLPWEHQGHGVGSWWETAKLCLMQPSYAFAIMRQYGGMASPMLYCGLGLAIGTVGQMLWYVPMMVGVGALANKAGGNQGPDVAVMVGSQVVGQVCGGIMGIAIGATVGLLIMAGIAHVCLMMVGGAKHGYETTLRTIGFAQGSTAWLNVIPVVGGMVAGIWMIVLEIIGLAKAHEIDMGKSALAVLLPIAICGGCAVIIVIAIFASAAGGAFGR